MIGRPPRHAGGATGPVSAASSGCASAVRDRHHRDLHDRRRVLAIEALRVRVGADARRERIARVDRHVHHAPALHAVLRTVRPVRERLALREAIVLRVGVDEAADGAVLVRDLRLDAAPRAAVARDHDRALHRDAAPLERVVVVGDAVVHVDERRRDVAVGGVRVVRRQLLALLVRGRIFLDRGFLELERELRRRDQLDHALDRAPGKSTSKRSMVASNPYEAYCARSHSALSLPYGEPTWCGRADRRRIDSRMRAGSGIARNFCSHSRSTLALAVVKPRMPSPSLAGEGSTRSKTAGRMSVRARCVIDDLRGVNRWRRERESYIHHCAPTRAAPQSPPCSPRPPRRYT